MIRLQSANFKRKHYGQVTLVQRESSQVEWTIGRSDACDLQLDGDDISRYHAGIELSNGAFYLYDTSTNGSLVNGEMLLPQERHRLKIGDKVEIGSTTLYVEDLQLPGARLTESSASPLTEWETQDLMLRCYRIVSETHDTKTFWFTAEPALLFSYQPGQFVNLEFDIRGEKVKRPYSLSSSPTRPYSLSVTVKRVEGGFVSNWLQDEFKVGDTVRAIGGTKGSFSCTSNLPPKILLLGAGSGITPLMSMVRYLYDAGLDTQTDIVFLYSARSQKDMIFYSELSAIAAQMKRFRLGITLSRPDAASAWAGYTGRVSQQMLQLLAPDFMERSAYVCGPNGFTSSIKSLLKSLDFPMDQYQQESFGGKVEKATPTTIRNPFQGVVDPDTLIEATPQPEIAMPQLDVPAQTQALSPPTSSKGNTVQFLRSQVSVPLNQDMTLLEIAEQEGVAIRSGCQAGVCGTCKVRLVQGKVRHDPTPDALTQAEQDSGYVLACIAYAEGTLEVEA
jgi:glycine betaine catabolism B